MWDGLKKTDSCLWAILRPFVWLNVILIAIAAIVLVGSVASAWLHKALGPTLALAVIAWSWVVLIAVVLFAVIVSLIRRRRTK